MKLLLLCLCVAMAYGFAPLRTTKNGRSVPDSWIIKLKDGAQLDDVEAEILDMFTKMRIPTPRVTKIDKLSPALTLKIPASLLTRIRSIGGIEYIQEDSLGTIFGSQNNPTWGIDRIDSRSGTDDVYNYNDTRQGAGANIYIVDTGIQTTHVAFGGRSSQVYGATDDHGHGTHCAGTAGGDIYGIAREANVYSAKVCDYYGQCPASTVLAGLNAVVNHGGSADGAGVVSMSLGWSSNPTVDSYAQNMIDSGYTVSVAAGNENSDACYVSPARVPDVITAGATDSNDKRAYFSNYGSCLDLFAPGVDIKSAGYSYWGSDSESATMSGTSMACPHVTGAAAVYLGANPGSSPASVHAAIVNDATIDAVSDTVGSPNKLLYVSP